MWPWAGWRLAVLLMRDRAPDRGVGLHRLQRFHLHGSDCCWAGRGFEEPSRSSSPRSCLVRRPHSNTIFNAVFFVVVISTIVQGTSLEWFAGRLGLLSPAPVAHEAPLEVSPLSKLDLIDFAVAPDHAIAGAAVRELGLPRSAIVAVVVRGEDSIPPRGSTLVRPGDRLFVLAPRAMRKDVDDVFARWRRRI